MAATGIKEQSTRNLIAKLWPSEQRAISAYRATLCQEDGTPPSLREAICRWEEDVAPQWRREKLRRDIACQIEQIRRHRIALTRQLGECVSLDEAAQDWVHQQADHWRQRWEQCSDSDVPIDPFLKN